MHNVNYYIRKELDKYISEKVNAPFTSLKMINHMGIIIWKVKVKAEPENYIAQGEVSIKTLQTRLNK